MDRLDKISNIIFAISTFILTLFIFIYTNNKDNRKEENVKKIDFLKVLLLENNSDKFLNFYEQILNLILSRKNNTLLDSEKSILLELINDEHKSFRLKFYDLILPFNAEIYRRIKSASDDLINEITIKVFDPSINYFDENYIDVIERKILQSRTEVLKIILKI
ncbi:hypothetical protein [Chryseobacterium sp.]|uniref:hypothetical protein n=1 Tax=Chryseobacterium sp. TaxID=1871047 RepID=UPI0012CD8E73|nr:hypothetical protein [Chryseobacterium sp.]MPS66649.1 hypothetical protein [Chryseobacterium sp.]